MSTLIAEICAVEETAPIEGADRIERVRVKNWWCVAGKGQFKVGDKAAYLPPDSVIPKALAEVWGIAKYCSPTSDEQRVRIRAAKFRGVPSFGTIQKPDGDEWKVGDDVKAYYGITKYEPPVKACDGDTAPDHPAFHQYDSLKRFGDYPNTFAEGERVIVTEKIHGTNCRIGWVLTGKSGPEEDADEVWEFMCGSHNSNRKEYNEGGARSLYWMPLKVRETEDTACPLADMIADVWFHQQALNAVIVFGEIFGEGVQDMQYGQKGKSFRVFDIAVDGAYLDHDRIAHFVSRHPGVEMVPVLYDGPFSRAKMDELVDGPTTVCKTEDIREPFKGREGIVIKPERERSDFNGRAILRYVSAEYHARKNKNQTEDH